MTTVRLFSTAAANSVRLAARWMFALAGCLLTLGLCATRAHAQDLPIYTDSLQNGFQNWSWSGTNLSNTSPVQSGSDSVAVTYTGGYQAFSLHSDNLNTTYYSALSFWVNGGPTGGQQFVVHMIGANEPNLPSVPVTNYIPGGVIPANAWVHVTIPLADLQAASLTDFSRFWLQESTGSAQPVYYVDTISLVGLPPPSVVHVNVGASQSLQTVNSRDFGINTAIWDGYLGTQNTVALVTAVGAGVFRYPGGSASDAYDWTVLQYGGQSATPTFAGLIGATGAQAMMTANYGSGTPQMAAAWVAYCNATPSNTTAIGVDSTGRDWKTASYWATLRGASPINPDDGLNFLRTGHAAPFGFKNWEIGNECFGGWENDTHSVQHDPITYANAAQAMTALMRQVDPTIKVGVVVTPSEDDYGISTESVTNPVTGVKHSGWTAVLLSNLASLNYVPDFVIIHNYPAGGAGDAILLQSWSWAGISASTRTMLTDYLTAPKTVNTQLIATENNTGTSGKQSVSLVDGLYCAESIGGLMQTEFQGLIWWDLRNGADTTGDNSPSYYGWRLYEDNGMVANGGGQPGSALDTPYPPYFAEKLASKFARGGDTIVGTTVDFPYLSVFAAKRANGGLSLLVVNTDPGASLNTQFSLSGYSPAATATTYQYGETEDNRQSTGASVDLTQGSLSGIAPTFGTTFPPYSMTVINLTPAAPTIVSFSPTSGPVGTAVTIMGTNLTGASVVGFTGQHAASFTVNASGTQITTTVPMGAVTGTLAVATPGGTAKSAASFAVTASTLPTITSFSPTSGAVGAAVVITGTNFTGATVVGFQGQHAKTFTVNGAGTQITTTVPTGAATGPLAVATPAGTAKSSTVFTVH